MTDDLAKLIVDAGLTGPSMRAVLLAFQSTAVLESLPTQPDHADQVYSDVRHLRGLGREALGIYVRNAAAVVSHNRELADQILEAGA